MEIQKSLENFRYILEDKIHKYQEEKELYLSKIKHKETYLRKLFKDLIDQSKMNNSLFKNFQINYKMQDILRQEIGFLDNKFKFSHLKIVNFLKKVFQTTSNSQHDLRLRLTLKGLFEEFLYK